MSSSSVVSSRRKRARESFASRANNAALWLSVWRMMCRRKVVFGLGACGLLLELVNYSDAHKMQPSDCTS